MTELQSSDNRIHSQELAHYVGYAEYPHIEIARTALRVELLEDHASHLEDAQLAGIEAIHLYADGIANDLARYVLRSESASTAPLESHQAEKPDTTQENYPGVRITKDEMAAYAEDQNVAGSSAEANSRGHKVNPNANKASSLWGTLSDLHNDLERSKSNNSESVWSRSRVMPLIEVNMDIKYQDGGYMNRAERLLSVSMDTLVSIVDEYDRIKALHPSKSHGMILGTGFGESKMAFLRGFVEYKKTQLAEETTD
jgi:hypothetical protein